MVSLLALVIAALFAVAAYAIRHGNTVRLVIGLAILANAVNLLIIAVGFQGEVAPFIGAGGSPADPLVQALILTAIVIGLGVTAFALGLAYVLIREEESTEVDEFRRLKG
ncbi:MAG: sodium:proton antiporter [Thermoplasmata archaeon]|nr:sodium:proton antiporter [Thermoplasmata archaeon]